jgi:hypothetical protein
MIVSVSHVRNTTNSIGVKTNYQNRSTLIPGKADKAMASSEYRTVQPRKATATKFVANANLPQQ